MDKLKEAVSDLKLIDESIMSEIKKSVEDSNREITEEEIISDPTFILYKQISDNTIKFFEDPEVQKIFVTIGKSLGETISSELVKIIGMGMTQSAYNALIFYDDVLRQLIKETFMRYTDQLDTLSANNVGTNEAIKVLTKRITELENKNMAKELEN